MSLLAIIAGVAGGVLLLYGLLFVGTANVLHARELVILSHETVNRGLGVACSTALSFQGAPPGGVTTITDGPCGFNVSDVCICYPIGRAADAGIGCDSFAQATVTVAAGGAFLVVAFISWAYSTTRQSSTAPTASTAASTASAASAASATTDVIALLPHTFQSIGDPISPLTPKSSFRLSARSNSHASLVDDEDNDIVILRVNPCMSF